MLKKNLYYLGIITLVMFSFYYTDIAAKLIRKNDPIMQEILKNKELYETVAVDAILLENGIIPGINGKEVNIEESYNNMKRLGEYNDTLLVFDEVIPDISITDNYNQYIISGNKDFNKVALVFQIEDLEYLKKLIDTLGPTQGTFFIDGLFLENNFDILKTLNFSNHQLENGGYDTKYTLDKFLWTNNLITTISKSDAKFCFTKYTDLDTLELCSRYKLFTVLPSILGGSYPYSNIKKNLENGSIIYLESSLITLKELPTIISYIKQKGYEITTLNNLLTESLEK